MKPFLNSILPIVSLAPNALSADDIDDELAQQLQQRFSDELRDSKGQKPKTSSVRLLSGENPKKQLAS
ncbi:hypothetical protein PEC18_05270 [Paucibacter sp. O1-1]|nr:hypothetical protein [Paucibacter sp. O1-1]MDA3825279.1 hypothetical protein [Paucibacter sp. O1-1]